MGNASSCFDSGQLLPSQIGPGQSVSGWVVLDVAATTGLAGEGLVELASNASDRRATGVTLTPAGRELLRRASQGHIAFVRKVFSDALDGERSAALCDAFERVYELLIAHGILPRPRPADHP